MNLISLVGFKVLRTFEETRDKGVKWCLISTFFFHFFSSFLNLVDRFGTNWTCHVV
jgi:hypothetical protein